MPAPAPPGRRARKKAATRQALSDAALRLFLARGFADVTVREIADAVDVSTTTLMKHFPTKEALVFDRDDEIERALVAAVTERPAHSSAFDALRAYLRARVARAVPARVRPFLELVRTTPALSDHWHKMWLRHAHVLARALARDLGRPASDATCTAMAHLVLEAAALAERSAHPARTLEAALAILEHGWPRAAKPGRR
ncbi:MAG TPA: helix-turn-helix domain-containing protein [Kofleriaceae bacterium]|nr:helix-turn-helix domain-containing protein [Kofleriaceae bacterium]